MAMDLSLDPYVPTIGTLPPHATLEQAQQWVARQQSRYTEGVGFSFAVIDVVQGRCAGFVGLWIRELSSGRAAVGYGVAPSFRGRKLATTIPELHRIELYIEPWNTASSRTAEHAGYLREGLLKSHQEIGGQRRDMLLYSKVRN
jgi:ribosomal-protein-alanine N-acetyltransferase